MKGDTLFYRFPKGEIQKMTGTFNKVENFSGQNGFVVADFNLKEKYIFVEKEFDGTNLFFSSENVKCLSKEEYLKCASDFLQKLKKQKLSKAIFSRVKQIDNSFDIRDLFDHLCVSYPNALVYLISSPLFGTWIGATPEILLESTNGNAKTIALAGTLSNDSPDKWSTKEIEEQQYVTDFVQEQLENSVIKNVRISKRDELTAGPVKHLRTQFQFEIAQKEILTLVENLHPTPAVSGLPRKESLALIEEVEKHQRKFYAGVIGLISENETNLFVNLRCAEIQEDKSFLYLGGGFTKDSNLEKEWNETERKAETLLNVMQKN